MKGSHNPEMVLRDVFSDKFFDHIALRMLHPVWEGLKAMTDHSSTLQSQVNYGQGIDWSSFQFKREKTYRLATEIISKSRLGFMKSFLIVSCLIKKRLPISL